MNRFRSVELYRDDQRRLVAIESIETSRTHFNPGGQLYVSITPLAVIMCIAEGHDVLSVDADSAKLDRMKQQHPELEDLIARLCTGE